MHLFNSDFKKRFSEFDWMIIFLFLIGVFFAVFSLHYSQAEDMGQFLSETAVLARGQSLYRDIFELKDPLFFYSSTLITLFIGRSGPYILDAIAVAIAAPVAYLALKSLYMDRFKSAVGAVLFVGTLSGGYFSSFRTGTICLVLIVSSIITINKGYVFTTGVIFAIVLGYKMPYIPFLVCPFILGLKYFTSGWKLLRLISGSLITILMIVGILNLRGEFFPYLDMVKINFQYRKLYPTIVGIKSGVSGHIDAVDRSGSSVIVLIIATFSSWFVAFTSSGRKNWPVIASLVMLQLTVLFVVFTTAMWSHHLQMLCLLGFASYALVFTSSLKSFKMHAIQGLCILILISINFQVVGFRIPIKPRQPLVDVIHPKWIVPPEVAYVESFVHPVGDTTNFARLGPNDDLGLVSFLPNNWKLICPYYAQGGMEDLRWISKITKCIADKPDVIFVSPGFFSLIRPAGDYELLKTEAKKVLDSHFFCIDVLERPGAEFCRRVST
jgi:hypothetical protein